MIKLTTLQYPQDYGSMAVPHSQIFFLAAQLQHLAGWDLPSVAKWAAIPKQSTAHKAI